MNPVNPQEARRRSRRQTRRGTQTSGLTTSNSLPRKRPLKLKIKVGRKYHARDVDENIQGPSESMNIPKEAVTLQGMGTGDGEEGTGMQRASQGGAKVIEGIRNEDGAKDIVVEGGGNRKRNFEEKALERGDKRKAKIRKRMGGKENDGLKSI